MPASKRPQREPTDDWEQLRLFVQSPEQETYELLRPIVLFGVTPRQRARATGTPERTLRRKADRFDAEGMTSLLDPKPEIAPTDRRRVPATIRQRILALKAEYPAFRPRELAEICRRRHDCRVDHKTVQRILEDNPVPAVTKRRYPPYGAIADPVQRRLAVVALYFDGWNIKSIAGYLETSRSRVYEVLYRFFDQDFAGLTDQSRAPKQPARKVDFKAMAAVRRLQANPELGEWRIHAALEQLGIHLSPRTCGRILAQNRALGLPHPGAGEPHEPKAMPFAASYRHEIWSVDVRYIEDHRLELRKPVYVLSVLENYSRAILASVISPRQDLTAYLLVLRAALAEFGAPTKLVSDSGSIFKAKQARAIYDELGIEKQTIDQGQPWQNYIETMFSVMHRMADYHYAQASTWSEMRAVHDRFFADYNHQSHFAHRGRPDGKRSPQAVLGWVHGLWCDEATLNQLFRLRSDRRFDQAGYVRYKRWRIYGARGLAGRTGSVWLFGEVLTVTFNDDTLSQYHATYEPDARHLQALTDPRLYEHRFPAPQQLLWGMTEGDWHLVQRLPPYQARKRLVVASQQTPLFDYPGEVAP
jgi:putative transposase